MIVFLYRWKVKAGLEEQFVQNWSIITVAILRQCGSYGSRLHQTENGEFVGYAQWPDKESREKCQLDETCKEAQQTY